MPDAEHVVARRGSRRRRGVERLGESFDGDAEGAVLVVDVSAEAAALAVGLFAAGAVDANRESVDVRDAGGEAADEILGVVVVDLVLPGAVDDRARIREPAEIGLGLNTVTPISRDGVINVPITLRSITSRRLVEVMRSRLYGIVYWPTFTEAAGATLMVT